MMNLLTSFLRDESGQDIIEYALLASFIAFSAYGATQLLSDAMNSFYANQDTAGQSDLLVEVPDPN